MQEVKRMQRLGFVHDMLDVKVLILFVTARINYPMTIQEIYEVCYQDESLSYFDVCTAIPEMVSSGHLTSLSEQRYEITEKGRQDGRLTEDSLAFTVKRKAEDAVFSYNQRLHRSRFVKVEPVLKENGEYSVRMTLDDETGNLMTLELMAPNQRQAMRLSKLLEKKAETIYSLTMTELLDEEDDLEA